MKKVELGPVSAYALAKAKGYTTKTEEEWIKEQANFHQDIVDTRDAALNAITEEGEKQKADLAALDYENVAARVSQNETDIGEINEDIATCFKLDSEGHMYIEGEDE